MSARFNGFRHSYRSAFVFLRANPHIALASSLHAGLRVPPQLPQWEFVDLE
jgi:hypothetical protein